MIRKQIVKNGMLEIGGIPADKLADVCGTPLFIYEEDLLKKQLADYKNYFVSEAFETEVIYASKAFTCKAMLQLLKRYGFGLDVVSGGELFLAQQSSFPMNQVYFHGNNKTDTELEMAVKLGCRTIVIDNLMECRRLIQITEHLEKNISAILRINPGITAHTHKFIVTADVDSKFGTAFHNESLILEMIHLLENSKHVKFEGFHVHIGSQIFDLMAYDAVIERMVLFIKKLKTDHDIQTKCLDLGGGFGVRYTDEDEPRSTQEVCSQIIEKCEKELQKNDIKIEKVMIEPGRSIVAEAGHTLYRVGFMKETPNKNYLFIDGGMTDNIRVALYEAKYECDLANKMDREKSKKYTVAGKCCESGDILIEGAMLPEAESEDLMIVYGTGAYGYSMASNYNRLNKPAVVFVRDGNARIVIKRESYSDQLRFETDEEVIV